MASRSRWKSPGEVRVEFGLLFGLVAILSFFAAPFITGGDVSTPPQEGLASLNGQPGLKLGQVGGRSARTGTDGRLLNTSDALSDTATGMGTNATSTEGMRMGRAAAATAKEAGELNKLARQLEGAAGGNSELADILQSLAGQGTHLASAQQAMARSCRGKGQCAQSPGVRQAEAAFQADLQRFANYLSNHPEALTPELEQEISRHTTSILSRIATFQSSSGRLVLNTKDMGKLQDAYNRCVNREDSEACIEQALQ